MAKTRPRAVVKALLFTALVLGSCLAAGFVFKACEPSIHRYFCDEHGINCDEVDGEK